LEERADAAPSVFDGPLGGFAHSVFELGEDLLDRIEIGAVGRQEEHPRADSADHETDGGRLVGGEIVEHDDVALLEGWDENLLDIGGEALAIDGAVDHERRVEPIAAQSGDKGQGFPVAMRGLGHKPAAFRTPAAQRRHIRLDPCLVDENETRRVNARLAGLPALALARDVRPILLAGEQAFF
jgi:hypothetical protein